MRARISEQYDLQILTQESVTSNNENQFNWQFPNCLLEIAIMATAFVVHDPQWQERPVAPAPGAPSSLRGVTQ